MIQETPVEVREDDQRTMQTPSAPRSRATSSRFDALAPFAIFVMRETTLPGYPAATAGSITNDFLLRNNQGLHSGRLDAPGMSGKAEGEETLLDWIMENLVAVYPGCLLIPS